MQIIDLDSPHEHSYFCCLEDWSDEMAEAGDHKARWYARMKDQGLRVKLAVNDDGAAVGMIQYVPIEHSTAQGEGLYHILCIWVHGYPQGVGNQQGHGLGAMLLEAAEQDARELGATGMSAWGLIIPTFMRARWFRRHGYQPADRIGVMQLVWKPFTPDAVKPTWIRPVLRPQRVAGQVTVTALTNGWCPAQNLAHERARRAVKAIGAPAVFQAVDTGDRDTLLQWGLSDALFIDDREARTGPPPTYESLHRSILKKVQRLR
jgi:GNAT superfamily N-acetyltransferase